MEFHLEDFSVSLDDDENCVLTLNGEDGEKVVVTLDLEKTEELSGEMAQIMDLKIPEEDED